MWIYSLTKTNDFDYAEIAYTNKIEDFNTEKQ